MSKISFNAKALGIATYSHDRNVGSTVVLRSFQPVMVSKPGIEAILEGLRLSDIEGFEATRRDFPACDIDR